MENINNEKKEKYKCLFTSKKLKLQEKEYIQSSKFINNNSFVIFYNKKIIKYNYYYNSDLYIFDSIKKENEFTENDYIYDYDLISNQNNSNAQICICSKGNPIRILNDELSLVKSFTLENKQKESYLSSIFIKYEPFGLDIYTGKNHLSKIDLIKQKEMFTIYDKNFNYLSCFDFDIKYSCYFLGSYSNNLLMCDYKTDKIVCNYKQEKPVNQIKLLTTKEYSIIVGYRNSDYICLFDIRKMDKYINKFTRNAITTKKINFLLDDKENNLYSGTDNGKILIYNFDKFENKEININENNYNNNFNLINKEEIDIGINDTISSIDLNNELNLLVVTNGKYNYIVKSLINNNDDSEDDLENKLDYSESLFNIYKI